MTNKNIIVSIHQPEHLIYLGLINKIQKSDIFVILDTVQFEKNNYQNRNKIRTSQGWQWLTVPVEKDNHKPIKDIKIANDIHWKKRYLATIKQNYNKSPYFNKYYPKLEYIYHDLSDNLLDLNCNLIFWILNEFNISCDYRFASMLFINPSLQKTDLLLEICKKLNATTYLSGIGAKDYLELDKFEKENIKVEFNEFIHPVYKQRYEPFIPNLSAIDYLFNVGEKL